MQGTMYFLLLPMLETTNYVLDSTETDINYSILKLEKATIRAKQTGEAHLASSQQRSDEAWPNHDRAFLHIRPGSTRAVSDDVRQPPSILESSSSRHSRNRGKHHRSQLVRREDSPFAYNKMQEIPIARGTQK